MAYRNMLFSEVQGFVPRCCKLMREPLYTKCKSLISNAQRLTVRLKIKIFNPKLMRI